MSGQKVSTLFNNTSYADMLLTQCVSLAYFEMRLFLARLLFNFDLEWTPACVDWEKQQAYSFWIREPLLIKLKPVLDAEKSRSFLE